MTSTATRVDPINLSDLDFWAQPLEVRDAAFRELRTQRPVSFHNEPEVDIAGYVPRGYYAVTRHIDIAEISRNPTVFSSASGGTSIRDLTEEDADYFSHLANSDDPRHAYLRRIVSAGFTPRRIRMLEEQVEAIASELVDELPKSGACDFVATIADRLPTAVICTMMGIPASRQRFITDSVSRLLGNTDPDYAIDGISLGPKTARAAARDLVEFGKELAADRLRSPQDDLTTALVHANVDGEALTEAELGSFFQLLCVAGAETTRTALAWGLVALTRYRDQRDLWWGDYDRYANSAVEEIVRWATPVLFMRRTLTQPVTLGGTSMNKDDKVIMFYWSANRDESVFENPGEFRIAREPNQHYGFGAPGPHFCLGAHLARKEIRSLFNVLHQQVPDIAATGQPDRLRSMFINGIKHLDCRYTK